MSKFEILQTINLMPNFFKFALLALLCGSLFLSCEEPIKYHRLYGETMGTYYSITYEGNNPSGVKQEIESLLIDFNNSLSTYIKESTISSLNSSSEGIELPVNDIYFLPVFQRSQELYTLTDGDLNTSIAPLVNYWGFGYKGKNQVTKVDSMAVDSILSIVRNSSFELMEKGGKAYIKKSSPKAEIDFSSLAKGYGIDKVADYFDEIGVQNYLIDIGGEARSKGKNGANKFWTLAINKPKDDAKTDDMEIILELENKSLATSGNYRIYYESEGRKFAHIINPKSGFSALSNLLSASIIADDCMTADGLATAMMVKGLDGAIDFLEKNKYPACLIYDGDGDDELEKYYANGFKNLVINER